MKKSEANKIAKENSKGLSWILKQIEGAAKNGSMEYHYWGYISINVLNDLMQMGYRLSEQQGPAGERICVINWE